MDLNITKNSPDLTNNQELDDYINTLSSSAPTAHEANNMAHKFITSPPRSSNSISIAQSPSNPISIRSSHHRNRYCVSAPSSANASPTSSMRNSPLLGNMLGRSRNSNSVTMGSTGGSYGGSYGGSWYGKFVFCNEIFNKTLLNRTLGCLHFETVSTVSL